MLNKTFSVNTVFFLEDKNGKQQAIYNLIECGKRFNIADLETDGYKVCGLMVLNNSKEAYRYCAGKSNSESKNEKNKTTAFDGVIFGYKNQVKQLLMMADMINHKDKYVSLGARPIRNCIIEGPVGLGKSLMAECFLREVGCASYILRRNKSSEAFLQEIAETFEKAKNNQPSVVLCDDLDHWRSSPDDEETFTALVSAIDSVKNDDIFVISTINDLQVLPSQLKRRGRQDVILSVGYPEDKDVEAILEHYLKNKHLSDDVNFEDLSKIFSGRMTAADIDALVNLAAVDAAYAGNSSISMKYLVNAALKSQYEYIDGFEEIDPEEKAKTCLHEAAHICALEVLVPGSVGWASVLARGYSDLAGFVSKCKDVKRRPHQIIAALAGKVGTELKYPGVASGTMRDLSMAGDFVLKGLRDTATNGLSLLDIWGDPVESSSSYVNNLETVVTSELERYTVLCRQLLLENMPFLEKLHKAMMEKEVLLYSDIQSIKASCTIVPLNV